MGRNAIGRVKVTAPSANPTQPSVTLEHRAILRGDNSDAASVELVRCYAVSGVSGGRLEVSVARGIRQRDARH